MTVLPDGIAAYRAYEFTVGPIRRFAASAIRLVLLKQIMMQFLYDLLGFAARHREAQIMAGCAVANHADVERFQHAEHLFSHAAGFRQVVPDQGDQCQTFFYLDPAQRGQLHQQGLREQRIAGGR